MIKNIFLLLVICFALTACITPGLQHKGILSGVEINRTSTGDTRINVSGDATVTVGADGSITAGSTAAQQAILDILRP